MPNTQAGWLVAVAFVTGVAGIWLFARYTEPYNRPAYDHQETLHQHTEPSLPPLLDFIASQFRQADPYHSHCDKPKDRDEADLCEQQRMGQAAERTAHWGAWQFYISLLGLGALGATLLLNLKAVKAATDAAEGAVQAAEAARDEFHATHRPRIRVKHVWLRNKKLDDGPLKISLIITNVGDMPALINKSGLTIRHFEAGAPLPPDLPFDMERPGGNQLGLGITLEVVIETDVTIREHTAIEIRSGEKLLYCVGFIEYLDIEGPSRFKRTNFARVLRIPEEHPLDDEHGRFYPLDPIDPDYEYAD